ncbi:MAG: thymidylate synthase [Nanobdellota archaeon]
MDKIKIGFDPFLKRDIFKVKHESSEQPRKQMFNSEDVIVGNPSSNIAIGFIYTWKEDKAPKKIRDFFQRISNYAYLTGYWKTTNGARYVFSNILANPNVNKLVIFVFGAGDNGHLLTEALTKFWKNGVDKNGKITGSNSPNPKFEQVPQDALERIRKQTDLVVLKNQSENNFNKAEDIIKSMFQEPSNAKEVPQNVELYSTIIKNKLLYDDGCRFYDPYILDLSKNSKKGRYIAKKSSKSIAKSVHAKNLKDALEIICGFVFENGSMLEDQRNLIICESRSFTISIENPLKKIPEGFSKSYLEKYVKEFMNGTGERLEEFSYTYHERLFKKWGNQVQRAIKIIAKNPNTRRCILSLWDPASDLESPNPPCLDFIWIAIRNQKLEMHAAYRSHHLATITKDGKIMQGEGAFVPNIYALAHLQEHIAKELKIKRGYFVLTDFSGHLYVSEV